MATIPAKDDPAAAWLTVTWPGLIGCLTGMSERGVTVSMHDANVEPPELKSRPTPRGLILREAIEAARIGFIKDDILSALARHRVLVGNIIPVSVPMREGIRPAMVFEYDSHSSNNDASVRLPRICVPGESARATDLWQVATNQYYNKNIRKRCRRFERLDRWLARHLRDEDNRLTVEGAWKLLDGVAEEGGLTTYHSVVFEPNRLKMHISFCSGDESAPTDKRVELDVAKLLERPQSRVAMPR